MAITFSRNYEKWVSLDSVKVNYPVLGAFIIPLQNTFMTSQTIKLIFEKNDQ